MKVLVSQLDKRVGVSVFVVALLIVCRVLPFCKIQAVLGVIIFVNFLQRVVLYTGRNFV